MWVGRRGGGEEVSADETGWGFGEGLPQRFLCGPAALRHSWGTTRRRSEGGDRAQARRVEIFSFQRAAAVDGGRLLFGAISEAPREGFGTKPRFAWVGLGLGKRVGGRDGGGRRRDGCHDFEFGAEFPDALDFGEGFVEIAPGGLLAAEEFAHDVGAGGILNKGGGVGGGGGVVHLVEEGVEELGFEPSVTVLEPGGADDDFDELGFDGTGGCELAMEVFGELSELGGIFTGDDEGGGVQSMLHSVEAGDGLACDGGGAGGVLGVALVDCGSCERCHTTPC
jgi:hypothetical protein